MLDRLRTHLWWSLLTPCIPPGSFLFLFLPHLRLLQLLQSHGDCVQVGEQQGGGTLYLPSHADGESTLRARARC